MGIDLDFLVPIFLFLSLLGAFLGHRHYRFRGLHEVQQTLRQALESGQPLSSEAIEAMMPSPGPEADRRRAVVSLMLALALIAFAFILGEADAIGPLIGIAAFPLFLSAGYFWLARAAGNS